MERFRPAPADDRALADKYGEAFGLSGTDIRKKDEAEKAKAKEGGGFRPYANLSGKSGVAGYFIGTGTITVRFKDGSTYLYDYLSAGKGAVDTMAEKARAGYGLNRFINQSVRQGYRQKW